MYYVKRIIYRSFRQAKSDKTLGVRSKSLTLMKHTFYKNTDSPIYMFNNIFFYKFIRCPNRYNYEKSNDSSWLILDWCKVIVNEITIQRGNGIWKIVSLSQDKTTIKCFWVFIVKVSQFKMRELIVLKLGLLSNDTQINDYDYFLIKIYGLNYYDISSPLGPIIGGHPCPLQSPQHNVGGVWPWAWLLWYCISNI